MQLRKIANVKAFPKLSIFWTMQALVQHCVHFFRFDLFLNYTIIQDVQLSQIQDEIKKMPNLIASPLGFS